MAAPRHRIPVMGLLASYDALETVPSGSLWLDRSGNGRHLTAYGTGVSGGAGLLGQTSSDYARRTGAPPIGSGSFTLASVVQTSSTSAPAGLICGSDGLNALTYLWCPNAGVNAGFWEVGIYGGPGAKCAGFRSLSDSLPHQVAGTRNGTTLAGYSDGALYESTTKAGISIGTAYILIGGQAGPCQSNAHRLYSRAMEAAEIAQMYLRNPQVAGV